MTNELMIFENEDFSNVRVKEINGEPWFCLADVCRVLEIGNPSDVKKRLKINGVDSIEVGVENGINKNGNSIIQKISMIFINESNLYRAVLQSRKPSAEKFTDWITEDIIPSIRKTGGYLPEAAYAELQNRILAVEERLKVPAYEPSDWQVGFMKRLEEVTNYYRKRYKYVSTEYMLNVYLKQLVFKYYYEDFDKCKKMYLLTHPGERPLDVEIIDAHYGLKKAYDAAIDSLLENKREWVDDDDELDEEIWKEFRNEPSNNPN